MQSEKVLGKVLVKELIEKAVGDTFTNEDFWACHYALVKKYCDLKKKALLREGKLISSVEAHQQELEYNILNIITSLPKYQIVFGNDKAEEAKTEYKKLLPKALPCPENEGEEELISLAGKVIGYAIRERLTSKDSGININSNKCKELMGDFERDSQVLTPEFLSAVEARFGSAGKENALSHIREEGMNAIDALIEYYGEEASYWCDFLSNIEIAREEEEDREWA